MMDNRDIGHEIERMVAGLFGLALLAGVCIRLWRWYSGIWYKSVWSVIAGQPMLRSRVRWEYGLWEICPEGQLAALAVVLRDFVAESHILGFTLTIPRRPTVARSAGGKGRRNEKDTCDVDLAFAVVLHLARGTFGLDDSKAFYPQS